MINYIYTIHSPEIYDKKKDTKNHILYYTDENIYMVPRAFNSACVNPRIFYDLKKQLNIDYNHFRQNNTKREGVLYRGPR